MSIASRATVIFFLAACLFMPGCASSLLSQSVTSEVLDGGGVTTALSYGIKVNPRSSLHRKWIVVNDSSCPLKLERAGVTSEYGERDYSFRASGMMVPSTPIVAVEIRFLLYDMFGGHLKTLTMTDVEDLGSGERMELRGHGSWRAWESEVTEFYTAVSFVAQVRTAGGTVWRYSREGISQELKRIQISIAPEYLEPKPEPKK